MANKSLYERLGGEGAIMAAVSIFYKKVLDDSVTAPFFTALDMESQTKKQVSFMATAFQGPEAYKGRDLRTAHAKLVKDKGLTDLHFDQIALHLGDTLRELGIDEAAIDEVLVIVGGTRDEVLDR